MKTQLRYIIILLLLNTSIFSQSRNISTFINRADSVITEKFGNENWKSYYQLEENSIIFKFEGSRLTVQNDTIENIQPDYIETFYSFVLPQEITENENCSSALLQLDLKFDGNMTLGNPDEILKIPEFIKGTNEYVVLHPRQIRPTAKDYNLEKGIAPWKYCLNYTDSLKLLSWDIYTRLTEETVKDLEYGKTMCIDALTGKFIRKTDTVVQNLTKWPDKYRTKKRK